MLNRIYGITDFEVDSVAVAAAVLLGGGAGVTENVFDVPMIEPFLTTPPLLSSEIRALMTHPSPSGNWGKLNVMFPPIPSRSFIFTPAEPIKDGGTELLTLLETKKSAPGTGAVGSIASWIIIGPGASR